MITQHKKTKKWLLHTRDGSRVLGTHDTYEKALKQERAIQISKRRRKNPLENCDKRFEYMKEAFDPNLSILKRDLSENIQLACDAAEKEIAEYPGMEKVYSITPKTYKEFGLKRSSNNEISAFCSLLKKKVARASDEDDLRVIVNAMEKNAIFSQFITPYFGMVDVREIKKPFYFVHFTNRESANEIMESKTILGREEVIYSTYLGVQSEIVNTGFPFVYILQGNSHSKVIQGLRGMLENWQKEEDMLIGLLQEQDVNGEYVIKENSEEESEIREQLNIHATKYPFRSIKHAYPYVMVIGIADKGIEFYHTSDKEKQAIVPTQCIRQDSLRTDDLLEIMYGAEAI
jgi:hypothetical protein